jgi:hypothetical protein
VTGEICTKEGQEEEMEIHIVLQVFITGGIKQNITYHKHLFTNKFKN